MSDVEQTVGVVADEVWKEIPGFSYYQASNLGRIKFKGNNVRRNPKIVKQRNRPTSVGAYLSVSVSDDYTGYVSIEAHRLVCLAFHGTPADNGARWEVNHKDGDKKNNRPNNLEWVTRSENLHHAYQTGLRTDCTEIIVEDTANGEVNTYYSIAEFSRQFAIAGGASEAGRILSTHCRKDLLFRDRYRLIRNMEKRKVSNHAWVQELSANDFVNGVLIFANDSAQMEELTKVSRMTILHNVRKGKDFLCAGYVFRYLEDRRPYAEYTDEEARESREKYFGKPESKPRKFDILCKDYRTGEVREYDNTIPLSKDTGVVRGTIKFLLNKGSMSLFRGYVFKYKDDERSFPHYDETLVNVSLAYGKSLDEVIEAIHVESTTTELYPSSGEFAKRYGYNRGSVTNHLKNTPDNLFDKRWRLKHRSLV